MRLKSEPLIRVPMPGHLVAQNVTKRYGNLVALDGVSAEFLPGAIHAVLGENGAGKSTLMGVLSGFIRPQTGELSLDDAEVPLGNPQACIELGIEMVHQHFTLVPAFTVAENLALSDLPKLAAPLSVVKAAQPLLEKARSLGWELNARDRVADLPVGAQQRIEILKALKPHAKVLIFDEPTAVLSPDEVEDLFRVMRELKAEGKTIILIAHKLQEVMSVADKVTVLRRGQKVASKLMQETTREELASLMVGEMPELGDAPQVATLMDGVTVQNLTVKGDRGETAIQGVSFEISRGEIVGFGGVDGNGQVELAEALAGIREYAGEILTSRDASPDTRHPQIIAYIPQDRQKDGLALELSIFENLLITGHSRPEFKSGPLLKSASLRNWAKMLIQRFQIKTDSPEQPAASLSGGNQQKVVVARSLDRQPDLLIAVNPTRGLDIKATQYVHEQIGKARDGGAAVALFSTDLDELAALADRTLFLSRGRISEGQDAGALVG